MHLFIRISICAIKLTRDFGRKDPPEEYPSLDPCNPELGN
jgi:hypothetical protein